MTQGTKAAKGLAALEKRLRKWYKEQGIELEGGSS
jgi:hypothetical protein